MIFTKKILWVFVLSILPLSTIAPILWNVAQNTSIMIMDTQDYVISYIYEGDNRTLPTESLAREMLSLPYVESVSPEIYVPTVVHGHSAMLRGVDIRLFVNHSHVKLAVSQPNEPNWAIIGNRARLKFGLNVGEDIVVSGTSSNALAILHVVGEFRGSHDDEILIPLSIARFLVGYNKDYVTVIRVKTNDVCALNDYIEKKYESKPKIIANSGSTSSAFRSEVIMIIMQNYSQINADWVLSYGVRSVQIVSYTFIGLIMSLVLLGGMGVILRTLNQKSKDIGVLYGIGATEGRIRLIIMANLVKYLTPAMVISLFIGIIVINTLDKMGLFHTFGHTLVIKYDPLLFITIFAVYITLMLLTTIIVSKRIIVHTPDELIRAAKIAEKRSLEEVLG
ncbi:MAG: hypothetical protein DRN20_00165 [Thermoplasmata archaeon]|nr:MAG: hypothetical protein DRN20_00165 [Thermoplasmata archaeon]